MAYSSERVINVYDDSSGMHIYVGPDADSLGLVELRYVDELGRTSDRITIPVQMALLVSDAIRDLYNGQA